MRAENVSSDRIEKGDLPVGIEIDRQVALAFADGAEESREAIDSVIRRDTITVPKTASTSPVPHGSREAAQFHRADASANTQAIVGALEGAIEEFEDENLHGQAAAEFDARFEPVGCVSWAETFAGDTDLDEPPACTGTRSTLERLGERPTPAPLGTWQRSSPRDEWGPCSTPPLVHSPREAT